MNELEPGDIVTIKALTARHRRFWGHQITHVGVYIGNGKIIRGKIVCGKSDNMFALRMGEPDSAGTTLEAGTVP